MTELKLNNGHYIKIGWCFSHYGKIMPYSIYTGEMPELYYNYAANIKHLKYDILECIEDDLI